MATQVLDYQFDEIVSALPEYLALDPNFDKVSLLLHFDGADGDQAVQDSSLHEHDFVMSSSANCGLDTATKVFGTASLQVNAPPSTPTGRLVTQICDSFLFDDEDFFIEFRVKFYQVYQAGGYAHTLLAATGSYRLYWVDWGGAPGRLVFVITKPDGTTKTVTHNCGWTANTWYGVAVGRHGTNILVFIDGVKVGTYDIGTISFAHPDVTNVNNKLFIGGYWVAYTNMLQGWVDEWRMTKGLCRQTDSYTLDTEPFPGGRPSVTDDSPSSNDGVDITICENPEWIVPEAGNGALRFYSYPYRVHDTPRVYSNALATVDAATSGITVKMRFRTDSAAACCMFGVFQYTPAVNEDPLLFAGFYLGNDGKVYFGVRCTKVSDGKVNPIAIASNEALNDSEWHVACATLSPHDPAGDRGVLTLLIDGVEQESSGYEIPASPSVALTSRFVSHGRWLVGFGRVNENDVAVTTYFPGTASKDDGIGTADADFDYCTAWSGLENCFYVFPGDEIIGNCPFPSTSRACSPTSESPICAPRSSVRLIPSNR